MPETTVDIYCRKALDDQLEQPINRNTLDEQEQVCRAYCEQHGLTVGMVFREIGTAYQYRERPRLSQIRQRIQSGEIQSVVVTAIDRLSKNQVHLVILLEEMDQHHVTLLSVSEKLDETPMGRFAMMMLALMAEIRQEKAE
jgi:site-specific DNA recombinase